MTIDQFLEELSKVADGWERHGGLIRRTGPGGIEECPITAVANTRTKHLFEVASYQEAADELGLDCFDAGEIVCAGDGAVYSKLADRIKRTLGIG